MFCGSNVGSEAGVNSGVDPSPAPAAAPVQAVEVSGASASVLVSASVSASAVVFWSSIGASAKEGSGFVSSSPTGRGVVWSKSFVLRTIPFSAGRLQATQKTHLVKATDSGWLMEKFPWKEWRWAWEKESRTATDPDRQSSPFRQCPE